ncbi:hypothetical protein [Cellulomonas sp. P24]|uniref:hypothetical protein n=1 Tax=Cellulomonas sp. P24 TaxID=2885206 RepID=UPI00216B26DB|nr:hypothetical protein [Cellulomonas sp. P24]MCR6491715.1 hypothetical protein [Cellulomonas sp. P24]
MTEPKAKPTRLDAPYGALYAGGIVALLGFIAVLSSPGFFTAALAISGVMLICTGLIQRAIFLSR